MPERKEIPFEESEIEQQSADESAVDSSTVEAEPSEAAGIESEKKLFEDLYELVRRLDPDGAKAYHQLRDTSQEFRKITSAMTHTLEAGGAVARAEALMEMVIEMVRQYDTAQAYASHVIDRAHLPSGDELKFNQHYSAGLKAQHEAAERQAA